MLTYGNVVAGLMLSIAGVLAGLSGVQMLFGFQAVAPNDARVMLLFGEYRGSVTESGFYWVNPFFTKRKITLRVRNFETGGITTPENKGASGTIVQHKSRSAGRPSKVNDRDGNPIEISAVVVWRVINTAEALFLVDDYEDFVAVQSEYATGGQHGSHLSGVRDRYDRRGFRHELFFGLLANRSCCESIRTRGKRCAAG